jgi:hypothetical protein
VCVSVTMPDANSCKRDIACGPAYARDMPCPLGCYCTNFLDCIDGYMCNGSGKCVPGTR